MTNKQDSVDIENRARLERLKGEKSYKALADELGVNDLYLFYYMVRGEKPTKKTQKGRAARDALGIVSPRLVATRERNETLEKYAKGKGYSSYSKIGTLILKGFDPIVSYDDMLMFKDDER